MIDLLQSSAPVAAGSAGIAGLLVGSFLNVVIHRVPRMLEREWALQAAEQRAEPPPPELLEPYNLAVPASRCPSCGHAITARENIPVVSWLMLRGRCSACATPISARYPAIELATALLSALAVWQHGANLAGVSAMVLTWFLIALTAIDFDTQLLPDSLTLPLLWIGVALNLGGVWTTLEASVIGAMAGYLSLWAVYWAFRLATGKEGMGYGDFKLLAALGAWFGWQALPGIILLSSVVGAVVGVGLMLGKGRGRDVPIPFGPYLAGAGLLTLYVGRPIAAYFGLA
jgi:leader peptidase (prepilin peptidase)/N-methyltransferase